MKGIGALVGLGAGGTGIGLAVSRAVSAPRHRSSFVPAGAAGPSGGFGADQLTANIASGGPGKDGIPSIEHPRFIAPPAARFLRDEDPVFGISYRGQVRAYPQLILVWHEIVNDRFAGQAVSVTYCPLTGSAVAFQGDAPNGRPMTFGTTGNLINSNLLMYDRVTESEWPQLFGTAINGPQKGTTLTETPLVWSSWGRWREAHPDTAVLSTDTGFERDYGSDPYGSYTPLGGYYATGGPLFPVMAKSPRLAAKEVVVGVRAGEARLAVRKRLIEQARTLPLTAGTTPLVAVWDDELATGRVFVRGVGGRTLAFEPGARRDATGTMWSTAGRALAGPLAGAQLALADFLEVMWFGWYAFFPQTTLVA